MEPYIEVKMWAHEKFGGGPIEDVKVDNDLEGIWIGKVRISCGSESNLIKLKNDIINAYERARREKYGKA